MRYFRKSVFPALFAACLLVGTTISAMAAAGSVEASAVALVQALAQADYAKVENQFDSKMQQALPAAKLKAAWEQIQARAGKYEKTAEVKQTEAKGYRVVLVKTLFRKTVLWTQVAFDSSGKVAGLYFKPAQ